MYRKKDDLEHLIQSLTSSEKSYLTKAFKQSKEDSMYVTLYEQLQRAKSLMSLPSCQLSGKVLINKKYVLYETILKHLKQMHSKLSHDVSIQNLLADVEILYNHSLADQAMLLLLKARKIAGTHEKYGLYLQILNWEQKLSIVMDQPMRPIEAIRSEEEEILAKNAQINLLLSFYSQIMLLKKQHGYAKGTIKDELNVQVINHPSFPDRQECKSNKATYYHSLILSIYHWMTFDHELAYQYSKALIQDDNQNILPSDYINGLFQHITSSVCVKKFQDALQGIHVAQAYMEEYKLNQSNAYRQLFFAYSSTYKLVIYGYTGEKEKLKEAIHDAEHQLEIWLDFIPIELRQVISGNIMNAYIAIGDLDKAQVMWNQLFNRQSTQVRKDIYADLYLFRLCFLLQSQTYDLIPSASASAQRFYRNTDENKAQFGLESSIVQLFIKDIDYSSEKVLSPLLHRTTMLLENYILQVRGGTGFQEHYTRYIIWITAIERKIPYYKAARDWYKQHGNA
ncbi:hypothetical protein [Sphingobacterium faecium]|uniref:hypothetical protein n=1 Tax=Sphingobacterium faecium TaxID=34087 RepID=UPI0032085474